MLASDPERARPLRCGRGPLMLLALLALLAAVLGGCLGPGLEPPGRSGDDGFDMGSTAGAGGQGGGAFGNSDDGDGTGGLPPGETDSPPADAPGADAGSSWDGGLELDAGI